MLDKDFIGLFSYGNGEPMRGVRQEVKWPNVQKYSYLDYDNNKKTDYKSNNGRLQNWPQIFSIPVCASLCKITLQQLLSRGKMNFSNH